jgi:hypothetical protein
MPGGTPADAKSEYGMLSTSDPDSVTKTSWWSVAGTPSAALAQISARPPKGTAYSSGGSLGAAPVILLAGYAQPQGAAGAAVSPGNLYVEAFPASGGRTVLRVDAEVTYLPTRPASETIQGASTVSITAQQWSAHPQPSNAPTVVTDPLKINKITALINALPPASPGAFSCPVDFGTNLKLEFLVGHGSVMFVVAIDAGGCERVSVTASGKPEPALQGSANLIDQIAAIVGAHWQMRPSQ